MSQITSEILDAAKQYAFKEIDQYGWPNPVLLEISVEQAKKIAEKLQGDANLAQLGIYLMDIKLGQAMSEKKYQEHATMGAEAAEAFLNDFQIDQDTKENILNCIRAHHKAIPFESLEAEICANADCYRFISPKGVVANLVHLGKKGFGFPDALKMAEEKLEEKHNILTLDICKEELEPYYQQFKKLFREARTL